MAHVGKTWPYSVGRDQLVNAIDLRGTPKNLRWTSSAFMFGALGGGWGTLRVSEEATVDYVGGWIEWLWPPPGTADPKTLLRLRLLCDRTLSPHQNIVRINVLYDGAVGPNFTGFWDFVPDVSVRCFVGAPFISVPGVGSYGFTGGDLVGLNWSDY